MSKEQMITEMFPEDWEQVKSIYLEGIATGNATFQTEAPSCFLDGASFLSPIIHNWSAVCSLLVHIHML